MKINYNQECVVVFLFCLFHDDDDHHHQTWTLLFIWLFEQNTKNTKNNENNKHYVNIEKINKSLSPNGWKKNLNLN